MKRANQNGVTPDKALISDMAVAFLSAIEAAGYYAINYTNIDYLTRYFDADRLSRYDVWLAAWRDTRPGARHNLWQHTSTGRVDGITGNVDMNRAYIDYPAVIASAGLNRPVVMPDYAGEVCAALGLADETRAYLDAYRFAPDLWRKIWKWCRDK